MAVWQTTTCRSSKGQTRRVPARSPLSIQGIEQQRPSWKSYGTVNNNCPFKLEPVYYCPGEPIFKQNKTSRRKASEYLFTLCAHMTGPGKITLPSRHHAKEKKKESTDNSLSYGCNKQSGLLTGQWKCCACRTRYNALISRPQARASCMYIREARLRRLRRAKRWRTPDPS